MHLEHFPEQYKLQPDLGMSLATCFKKPSDILCAANVLGIKEESRIGVIQALWNYIKVQGLQDKVDRRVIHADEYLRPVRSPNRTHIMVNSCFEGIWSGFPVVPTYPRAR